jgi:hypothetical protein
MVRLSLEFRHTNNSWREAFVRVEAAKKRRQKFFAAHQLYFRRGIVRGCIVAFIFLQVACRTSPKNRALSPLAEGMIDSGEISFVNNEKRFVLIDLESRMGDPEVGAEFKTRREGKETGLVKISPERKAPFVSADIVGGNPAVGDRVSP